MKRIMMIVAFLATTAGVTSNPKAGEITLKPDLKIPPHYKPGSGGCSPGRGYSFSAEAPNFPSTYPKLNLRVFNGEVIGFTFEVPAKEGWKPWYDQPEGKPTSHDGSIEHYTQTIYSKKVRQRMSVRHRRALIVNEIETAESKPASLRSTPVGSGVFFHNECRGCYGILIEQDLYEMEMVFDSDIVFLHYGYVDG